MSDTVFVSAVTAWELATKARSGKWPEAASYVARLDEVMDAFAFLPLPITLEDARLAGSMAVPHKDPFDRLLAAQAQLGNLALATVDMAFRAFGTRVIW